MSHVPWRELEATVAGMTDQEKQRLLALVTKALGQPARAPTSARPTIDEFDAELAQVTFAAPPLPADCSPTC